MCDNFCYKRMKPIYSFKLTIKAFLQWQIVQKTYGANLFKIINL